MTAPPLPHRILLPLANPRTAADLVRIGAAIMDHGGTLIALGIVEVPEGMPLSEGATRARQARRLLQRVLEFTPDGIDLRTMVRMGRRAAEGICEVAAEEAADLIIFGWGGRAPDDAVFSPTIDELALRFGEALGRHFAAELQVLHVVPPDIEPTVRSQTERALATFVKQHARSAQPLIVEGAEVGPAILAEAQTADLVIMGAAVPAPLSAADADPQAALFGALPEAVATQADRKSTRLNS